MKTAIIILLDASGSMIKIKSDVIGSFNAFIEDQKKSGESTDLIRFYSFSNNLSPITDWKELSENIVLTEGTYTPSGTTALIDSMCNCIDEVGNYFNSQTNKPEKVLFLVITDGEENASKEFKITDLKNKISHQTEKYNSCFSFVGANVDSFSVGDSCGISKGSIANYKNSSQGYFNMTKTVSSAVTAYRTTDLKTLNLNE